MAGSHLGVISRALCRNFAPNRTQLYRQITHHHRLMSSTAPKRASDSKLFLKALGVTAGIGTAWAVYDSLKGKNAHISHEEVPPIILDRLPDVQITRKIVNAKDKTGLDLVLFQYQTCPFCCKVRAFLDSNGLSYSLVEVDAVLRQGLKWSPYKKVPTLLARTKDGKYVQLTDSTAIVSILATILLDPGADVGELAKLYPKVKYVDDNGKKTEDVVNKYFLMHQGGVPKGLTKEIIE